jgi:apolipoprotein N-acyltransferase
VKRFISPVAAGLLVAISMPPWGWWPLALIGIAWHGRIAIDRRDSATFSTGFFFALGWFVLPLSWMRYLSMPGFIATCIIFAVMHGGASYVAARVSTKDRHHRQALIVCHALVEVLRMSWPFGGVPIATLAIGQATSPLASLAPLAGVIGISTATLWVALSPRRIRAIAAVVLIVACSQFVNKVHNNGTTLDITFIQGGGKQGTHAIYTSTHDVFNRHLALTKSLKPNSSRDVLVWPENAVNVTQEGLFVDNQDYVQLAAEAQRLNVPIVVCITEDGGPRKFMNAAIVIEADGRISGRYDKVRRVPFGEYIPMRSLFSALGAPINLVPRDARPGDARAWLDVAGTRAAVAVSWEVFFGGRVNEGIVDGATFIINPTNGSSYTGTLLQSQQMASSSLRAREQSRWLVQVSPTGFSAFVSPNGTILDRTTISHSAIVDRTISLRSGRTFYSYMGNSPYILGLIALLLLLMQRRSRAFPQPAS